MYDIHHTKLNNKSQNLPLKRKILLNHPMYIRHLRLNLKRIDRLVKEDHLSSLTILLGIHTKIHGLYNDFIID